MKNCVNCGTALPDEAGFCAVCGTAQTAPAEPVVEQPVYVPPVYVAPPAPYVPAEEKKESVSVGGWFGRYCLNLIPVVGGLIYFIMLWVWAGNRKYEDSFRNWAKFQLIMIAIAVGLVALLAALMLVMGVNVADVMDEAMHF